MMNHMETLQELTQNLNRVRENAEALGGAEVVDRIDRFRVGLGQAISLSRIPDSISNPQDYGKYVDFIKAAVKLLGEIYYTEPDVPNTRRQFFRGYQKISGYVPNAEFENYKGRVEPSILRDASG